MNTWERIKQYINEKEIGETITRKELTSFKLELHNMNSIDSYRNQFSKAGFLKTISPGIYQKVKNIPKDLTTSLLTKVAYDKTYRRWFMNIEDRLNFHKEKNERNNNRKKRKTDFIME